MAKNAFGIQIENGRLTHQVHGSKQLRAKDKFNDRTVVVTRHLLLRTDQEPKRRFRLQAATKAATLWKVELATS
jgi:hypothetical protein